MIWLLTTFIKIISFITKSVPRSLRMMFGKFLGLIWFYVIRIRRDVVFQNIKTAFPLKSEPEIYQVARENYMNYGCGFIEFLLLPSMDEKLFNNFVAVEGFDIYQTAFKENKGVLLLSLHLGNWEFMSATCEMLKIPLSVLTKKFKSKLLNDVWVNLRMARGVKLLSDEKSTFQILKAIRKGEVVGFILDQFMGPPVGSKTVFFGHETGTSAALALFADRTRAPVIPVYNVRQPDGKLKIVFEKAVEFMEQGSTAKNISFMTQVYTSRIQEIVEKNPEQWLWLHRRWKPFRE